MTVSAFKICYTWSMKKSLHKFKISKNGFTLAEVLITLVIIGVVAAMTIPTAITRSQRAVFITSYGKLSDIIKAS